MALKSKIDGRVNELVTEVVNNDIIPIFSDYMSERYGIEVNRRELEIILLGPGNDVRHKRISGQKSKPVTNAEYKCTREITKRGEKNPAKCSKPCVIHNGRVLKYCPRCCKMKKVILAEGWGEKTEDNPLVKSSIFVKESCYLDPKPDKDEIVQEYPPPHPDDEEPSHTPLTFNNINDSSYGYINYSGTKPILKKEGNTYSLTYYILEDEKSRKMTDDEVKIMGDLPFEFFDEIPEIGHESSSESDDF